MAPRLATLTLPLPFADLGFPEPFRAGATTLVEGDDLSWGWDGDGPGFDIPACDPASGIPVEGWATDHVVLLVPDLDEATEVLTVVGLRPRLRLDVEGRPTAFYRVGPILEVIQSPVRSASLFGVALVTEEPLEVVVLRWRSSGFEVSDPKPAIQPGRRIITVKGVDAGLAVMSPDRAHEPGEPERTD